jgi:uncharacterized protein
MRGEILFTTMLDKERLPRIPLAQSSLHRFTRRQFLEQLGVTGFAAALPARLLASSNVAFQGHARPASASSAVVPNRAPLSPGAFAFLPLGSIQPRGWLRTQLRIQADGLSGHLDETWADVGPNSGWLGGSGESWERGPYYLDGLVPLAWLLDDAALKAKAQKFIDWTLDHQAASGMIGPATNDDWWPRIVMLKVLTQYQELTGDPRVIPVMEKYLRYQLTQLPSRPLRDWGKFRWQDELLSVIWLYNRTGSRWLLDLAPLLHEQGHDWVAQYADFQYTQPVTQEFLHAHAAASLGDLALSTHGVNNGQGVKAGPVWSLVSGATYDRQSVFDAIAALDRYHGLPNGMFSCDEHLAGLDPSQGSELCTVVEYMFSLEQSLAVTGDPMLGDRLEKLAFNALPGAFTDDMWAHQYNQEPNQVECSLHRKPWTTDGPESNLYGLEPNFGCCTANFSQGWPKFTNSLFLHARADHGQGLEGLVAAAYAPCEVQTSIAGTTVHIIEETEYPFRGSVRLTVNPAEPAEFSLRLRIPQWAAGTAIRVNGEAQPAPAAGTFARIERAWKAGDEVQIDFPMMPRIVDGYRDSVSVERGPLVFSYGVDESWVKLRERGMTADWQVFPARPWNYALQVNAAAPAESISVTEVGLGPVPFARAHAPVQLQVTARPVNAWRAEDGAADPLPESPVRSTEPRQSLALIPYAAAKLRITAFPTAEED